MTAEPLDIEIPVGHDRIALCGGPYSNFGAVEAFLDKRLSCPTA